MEIQGGIIIQKRIQAIIQNYIKAKILRDIRKRKVGIGEYELEKNTTLKTRLKLNVKIKRVYECE